MTWVFHPHIMAVIPRLIVCLIHTIAGLLSVSGTEINSKYVCLGDSVQAFQDIIFDECSGFVSLTKGKGNKQIAIWSFQNCILNTTVVNDYKDRVFLYQNGTITIHNTTNDDQGKYIVNAKTGLLSDIYEVYIYVPVAPSKTCKPIINQWGNKLHASLTSEECGRPVVTTYWKGDDGVSDTHDQLLKIAEGNTAHIYTACIEGPALQCAKNVTPIATCSSYGINGSKTVSKAHDDPDVCILYIAIFVPALVFFIVATVVQTLRYWRLKKECIRSETSSVHGKRLGEQYIISLEEPKDTHTPEEMERVQLIEVQSKETTLSGHITEKEKVQLAAMQEKHTHPSVEEEREPLIEVQSKETTLPGHITEKEIVQLAAMQEKHTHPSVEEEREPLIEVQSKETTLPGHITEKERVQLATMQEKHTHTPMEEEREPLLEVQTKGDCDKSASYNFLDIFSMYITTVHYDKLDSYSSYLDIFGKYGATETHSPDEKECVSLTETQSKGKMHPEPVEKASLILEPNVIVNKETKFS